MSSFGGAKPKASSKSGKKQKKNKRKDGSDESEEEKDVVPLDKEENVEDEMPSQHPRRMEEEQQMPANISKPMQHMIASLGNPKELKNASDLEKILYNVPYNPTKYKRLNDGSDYLTRSGNNTKSDEKEGESDFKDVEFGMVIKDLVNATMGKLYDDIKACPPPSSSTNPIFEKIEEIADYLTSVSKEYGKQYLPPSGNPFDLCPDTSVKKLQVELVDVKEQSSKISERKSKHDKRIEAEVQGEQEDEIPAVLEGEMTEGLKSKMIPAPSYNLQSENVCFPPPRCIFSSIRFGKLPDPNEHVENEDKSSSKEFNEKLNREGNQLMEDEIPVVLEEKVEVPIGLEHDIMEALEQKMNMLGNWAEDVISSVSVGRDEIPVDLEKKDELVEVSLKERAQVLSDHLSDNEKGEMSSPTHRGPPPLFTKTAVKTLPDPIERDDNQDKISSKSSKKKKKKKKKSKQEKSKITEDNEDEIPEPLKEISKVPIVRDEKDKIPTVPGEDEDETVVEFEGEDEISTTSDEDEIPAVLEEEDEMVKVFQNERVPPIFHYSPNSEITSPTPRRSYLPSTSFDQMLSDPIGRVDNQDKTSSKGSKKMFFKGGIVKCIGYRAVTGLEEKDVTKDESKKDKAPPQLSDSNAPLCRSNEGKDGPSTSESQQNQFINMNYDFSNSVVLWNRWSLISDDAIRGAIKNISEQSKLNLNHGTMNSTWCYGIATFEDVDDAVLCVNFFKEFRVKMQPILESMKLYMNKDQLAFSEMVKFKDPEHPVLAAKVFTWLTFIKILEERTPKFHDKSKHIMVMNISNNITYEQVRKAFSAFGEVKSVEYFRVMHDNDVYAAEIIFDHVFEAVAAAFAMDSTLWFRRNLSVIMNMHFRFFGDWVEHFFYPEMSNSVSFADAFSLMQLNKLKQQSHRESNRSQAYQEKTKVLQKSVVREECKKDKSKSSLEDDSAVFCGEEKPSGMKERAKMMGEITSQFFRRNETSNEGKSQENEKLNPIQESVEEESVEEKSERHGAKSRSIKKLKKGKKKRK